MNYLIDIGILPRHHKQAKIFTIVSFVLSFGLTVCAYVVATRWGGGEATVIIATLALLQVLLQLGGFFHLYESGARVRLFFLLATIIVVFVVVAGSVWVMVHLNARMGERGQDAPAYMLREDAM